MMETIERKDIIFFSNHGEEDEVKKRKEKKRKEKKRKEKKRKEKG